MRHDVALDPPSADIALGGEPQPMAPRRGASGDEPVLMVAACPFPCRRGTPIRIERLAETIAATGREVHVVAYHYGDETSGGALGDRSGGRAYRLHRIPAVPGRWNPAPGPGVGKMAILNPLLFAKALSLVRRHGIRLLHCHHYEGLLVGLMVRRLAPVSVVYDAHTLLGEELPYYAPSVLRKALGRVGGALDRSLPRRADHIIPVTEEIHDALALHGARPDRMTIVGNGLEESAMETFRNMPGEVAAGEVVYAGNLAAYQGIDLLLEAFARIAGERPAARLVLASPGPDDRVIDLAARYGIADRVRRVDVAGEALAHRLRTADVLANPRVHCPGYPLKLLNYMAAGRPIVSFRSSGKNLRPGRDALVVADGDMAGFAEAIARLLDDPAKGAALGRAAQKQVFEHFSWPAIAGRVSEAYARALALRQPIVEAAE
ncbi:MAG: glycosyltransferase family 4 protein [Paracoccaceae bacterium]|nr:glycosyltransferase family 4 protein [Paracoccaceae bacterium]